MYKRQRSTPITVIRKDRIREDGSTEYGLRNWGPTEFVPAPDDVFQERLYCIRYEREYVDEKGKRKTERYYQAPTRHDLERERKVIELLEERFTDWQQKGYIPATGIEEGEKTSEPIRVRGWAYWHQLFAPRQLLTNGQILEIIDKESSTVIEKVAGLITLNKCCDKMCIRDSVGIDTKRSLTLKKKYKTDGTASTYEELELLKKHQAQISGIVLTLHEKGDEDNKDGWIEIVTDHNRRLDVDKVEDLIDYVRDTFMRDRSVDITFEYKMTMFESGQRFLDWVADLSLIHI